MSVMAENRASECNGGKYNLVLKDVVFEIKSIGRPGNNEYMGKSNSFCFRWKISKK